MHNIPYVPDYLASLGVDVENATPPKMSEQFIENITDVVRYLIAAVVGGGFIGAVAFKTISAIVPTTLKLALIVAVLYGAAIAWQSLDGKNLDFQGC